MADPRMRSNNDASQVQVYAGIAAGGLATGAAMAVSNDPAYEKVNIPKGVALDPKIHSTFYSRVLGENAVEYYANEKQRGTEHFDYELHKAQSERVERAWGSYTPEQQIEEDRLLRKATRDRQRASREREAEMRRRMGVTPIDELKENAVKAVSKVIKPFTRL